MKKYNVAAVIPIYGRRPLRRFTMSRLLRINRLKHVVCIGDSPQDKYAVEQGGGIFVHHKNYPLGNKWNSGFRFAKSLGVDAVLYIGSDDMISENWMEVMLPLIDEYDLVGVKSYHTAKISYDKGIETGYFPGYDGTNREGDSIGAGRLISSRILDKIDWTPFDGSLNRGLDGSMSKTIINHGGKTKLVENENLVLVGVGCDKWENFSDAIKRPKIDNYDLVISSFPEVIQFYNSLYGRLKPLKALS
jgi:hypothetical protein